MIHPNPSQKYRNYLSEPRSLVAILYLNQDDSVNELNSSCIVSVFNKIISRCIQCKLDTFIYSRALPLSSRSDWRIT